MKRVFLATAVAATLTAGTLHAATVFEEDFSDDLANAGGASVLNFTGFDQFTVSTGTVDLIQTGTFSIDCASGGACVDLDGSTSNSGLFSSIILNFQAGVTYSFSAVMSGNQRTNGVETGTFGITGGIYDSAYSLSGDVFQTLSGDFSVASDTTGSVFFQDDSTDNVGAILDRVIITSNMAAIPLPASMFLMLGALGGLAGMRRRRGQS